VLSLKFLNCSRKIHHAFESSFSRCRRAIDLILVDLLLLRWHREHHALSWNGLRRLEDVLRLFELIFSKMLTRLELEPYNVVLLGYGLFKRQAEGVNSNR
jgi:hypothetical protein